MRKIERIFVHCTASWQTITLDELLREFRAKGWKQPGYHYVVFPDGTIKQLISVNEVSNGVRGYNQTAINVAYVGGITKDTNNHIVPTDNRTPAQKRSLRQLLSQLHRQYPSAAIMGHRSIWGESTPAKWQKTCPNFNAVQEYSNI